MGVGERLAVLRAAEGFVAEQAPDRTDAGWTDRAAQLARWRTERTFDEQRGLHDPASIYGCSDDELRTILDDHRIPPGLIADTLPSWARGLNDGWTRGEAATDVEPLPRGGDPALAFLPIVWPLVADVVEQVAAEATRLARGAPFSPSHIVRVLRQALIMRLAPLVGRIGVLELHAARLNGDLAGDTPAERFDSFVRRLADPGVAGAILRRAPVLGRLAYQVVSGWADASCEFLRAITYDWPDLRLSFGFPEGDELVEVVPAGDFHRGGRAVLALRFSSGKRLIYKPRSVDVESLFQRILEWLSLHPTVPDLRQLTVVAARDHGWVEYIEPRPCPKEEVHALYRRHGATLAVLHALSAADCHFENIVAAGAHPIVVDLETLFHSFPPAALKPLGAAEQAVLDSTLGSVLGVGLLPVRRWSNASARSVDQSGIGARPDEWARAKQPQWENEFTDEMREVLKERSPAVLGLTAQDGYAQDALLDCVDDIADGFAVAYRTVLANRDELIGADGLLATFDGLATRSIVRPTGHYIFALQTASHPSFLSNGVNLDRRFDRLLAPDDGRPPDSPVSAAERADLWSMDVPIFRTHPGSADIWCSDGRRVPDFFDETGLARSRRRIMGMSERDLDLQVWLIKLSIGTWALNRRGVSEVGKKAPLALPPEGYTDELACADQLARRLERISIRRSGEATWIGTRYWSGDDTWTVDAVSPNLFDGTAGILLFLAYVAELTDERRHLDLARETLRTFLRQLDRAADESAPPMPGGFSGVGGWIYALTQVGFLWRDDRLLRRASDLVPTLLRGLDSAGTVDLIGGAAGAIRPLLNLYELTHSEQLLDCALKCGEKVLAAAEPQKAGVGWLSPVGPLPLTGFSHGAAGISWALLRLYDATRDERFKDCAIAGIAYERSLFSPEEQNWRDLRWPEAETDADSARCLYFWCHGSAGIGLARLDTLSVYGDEKVLAEIHAAVGTTAAEGFRFDHSLCHGYASSAELMMLAQKAGIPTAPATDTSWGHSMLQNIRQNGYITGFPLGIENPGLMMGTAGIGYGLLRLSAPERVPSVLLLEPPASAGSVA